MALKWLHWVLLLKISYDNLTYIFLCVQYLFSDNICSLCLCACVCAVDELHLAVVCSTPSFFSFDYPIWMLLQMNTVDAFLHLPLPLTLRFPSCVAKPCDEEFHNQLILSVDVLAINGLLLSDMMWPIMPIHHLRSSFRAKVLFTFDLGNFLCCRFLFHSTTICKIVSNQTLQID